MENLKTYQERLSHINKNKQLTLAVEGKSTNLIIRISSSKPKVESFVIDTVYMRLDRFQAYFACLNEGSYNYLEKENSVIKSLLQFGFSTSLSNLETILTLTMPLKQRELINW